MAALVDCVFLYSVPVTKTRLQLSHCQVAAMQKEVARRCFQHLWIRFSEFAAQSLLIRSERPTCCTKRNAIRCAALEVASGQYSLLGV